MNEENAGKVTVWENGQDAEERKDRNPHGTDVRDTGGTVGGQRTRKKTRVEYQDT